MEIISASAANSLYWIGRYLLRAELIGRQTLRELDDVIDGAINIEDECFYKLGIDISYESCDLFLDDAVYGKHTSSIYRSLRSAKENGMMARDLIHDDLFLYINRATMELEESREGGISPFQLEEILEHLLSFWGLLDIPLAPSKSNQIIGLGRFVERVDLMVRLFEDRSLISYDLDRLDAIGCSLSSHYSPIRARLKLSSNSAELLEVVNSLYGGLFASEF